MARYVVAVSGGVDSVVLLDMLAKVGSHTLIVAHFDHGIRDDSVEDAAFVGELAKKYGALYETKRVELGKTASEELARDKRYEFLRLVCNKHNARLVTAHHGDDVVETVAINLHRGTGWRGLAVLDSSDISRPLLGMTKQVICEYATKHHLQWHEDSTNNDHRYLRNRLRDHLRVMDSETKEWVRDLHNRQVALKSAIDKESLRLIGQSPYSRYFFTHVDEKTAIELLRTLFASETGKSPTTPQRRRALHAIKVAKPSTTYEVTGGVRIRFKRSEFIVD